MIYAQSPLAIGLFLAFKFDFPASPAIVGVACAVVALAWVGAVVRRR